MRFKGALILAVVMRHIRRCATHIEGNDPVESRLTRGFHRPHNATSRAAKDGVFALEEVGVGQAATRLHEHQPRTP